MSDVGERTHEATPLRLQQARANGNIPKSAELAASLSMLGAIGAGYLTFANISAWLQRSTTSSWSTNRLAGYSPEAVVNQLQELLFDLAGVLLPFMATILLGTIAAHWIQTGPVWMPSKAMPAMTNLGWAKIIISLAVMVFAGWTQRDALFSLANLPPEVLVSQLFSIVAFVCLQVAGTLVLLGVFDFGLQWTSHRRRMRMSNQEIREEIRSQGGSAVDHVREYGSQRGS